MNKCKRSWCFNLSLLALSCCFQSVYAANAFEAESPWMLGDWNGQRSALQQKGYDFSFGYTGEMATLLDASHSSICSSKMLRINTKKLDQSPAFYSLENLSTRLITGLCNGC
jgi:carbohydrate-selective porin OprB